MQRLGDLKRQIEITKANIAIYEKISAEIPQQAFHWKKWLKFERDMLSEQEAKLKTMEYVNAES